MVRRGDGSIRPEILKSLLSAGKAAQDQVSEIQKEFSDERKDAQSVHDLHPAAFGLCLRLSRMDQVKRLAFLAAFDSYRDIADLDAAPQLEAFAEHGRAA